MKPSETSEKIQPTEIAAIERAKRLGTYGKIDRRAQYQGSDRAQPEALLQAVNAQGNHIRGLQSDTGKMQKQLYNLKLRNAIVCSTVTALLVKAPEILTWASRLFR
jgi:hypothetical protein